MTNNNNCIGYDSLFTEVNDRQLTVVCHETVSINTSLYVKEMGNKIEGISFGEKITEDDITEWRAYIKPYTSFLVTVNDEYDVLFYWDGKVQNIIAEAG